MSKKILIIGGAGFIGMNIIQSLGKKNNSVITIADNFFRGKMDNDLSNLVKKYNVRVVSADLTESSSFEQLENDYDQVYMLASVVGVEYTQKIPNELIRVNTMLIMNTLEWLKNSNCKKVLFTSTSECYAGSIEKFSYEVPTAENVPLCIDDISNPRFTYAVTKMLGESGFLNYAKVFGFECVIVRYHNVYGSRMGFKHVIPQVVKRFVDKESPFKVYGHDQTRAFNFIDDAVNGTVAAMDSEVSNGEIFHIGDMNAEITIDTLVRYIGSLLDYKGDYIYDKAHSGSVSRRCPDTTKATNILDYNPQTSWENGVKQTVDWYVEYFESKKEIFE
ncbi:NAD-dependent epimerase/dehydratase family protein [Flavobacteriaceae bacterium]|nr:NAD-dependent epimerase/dehydratase family protein [Flavobacteriaceae bacterium]|tara:strand:- start:125 stop:1123 length:999 start_codon:yes stop_codon:yes gene_type:complete